MKNKEELIKNIKDTLDILSNSTLTLDADWQISERIYSDDDLMNSTLVYMSIMSNIWITNLISQDLNEEQITKLVTEFADNTRQTIKLFTWLDMFDLANKL